MGTYFNIIWKNVIKKCFHTLVRCGRRGRAEARLVLCPWNKLSTNCTIVPLDIRTISLVLILDDNLDIEAHVRSNRCYLICLRHLIRSEQSQIRFFLRIGVFFLYANATWSELPSNISTLPMVTSYGIVAI